MYICTTEIILFFPGNSSLSFAVQNTDLQTQHPRQLTQPPFRAGRAGERYSQHADQSPQSGQCFARAQIAASQAFIVTAQFPATNVSSCKLKGRRPNYHLPVSTPHLRWVQVYALKVHLSYSTTETLKFREPAHHLRRARRFFNHFKPRFCLINFRAAPDVA